MKLTDKDLVLLSAAAQSDDRLLARNAAITDKTARTQATKLIRGGLVEVVPITRDQPRWFWDGDDQPQGLRITASGFAALGLDEPCEEPDEADAAIPPVSPDVPEASARSGSKKAKIIALLQRQQGATIGDLTAATGWLPHTTRAALTGLRKQGHAIEKGRDEDGKTTYRIIAAAGGEAASPDAPAAERAA